jgi:uncharacterized peroxidase-related enzyme
VPFFRSMPANAGPPNVFNKYPEIYKAWSVMSEALMNGTSPLSQGERELILAYAAGVTGCAFVCGAHSEVAYAWGIRRGLVEEMLNDPDTASAEPKLKALLAYVAKLAAAPNELTQADADAVFAAGWDEHALHDAICVTARAAFMQRLVQGHGFTPLPQDVSAKHAKRRIELGYLNLYPQFRDKA